MCSVDSLLGSLAAWAALSSACIREGQREGSQEVELSSDALGKLGGELYYDPVLMLRAHQRLSLLEPDAREAALRKMSGDSSLLRNLVSAAFEPQRTPLPLYYEEYLEEQAELRAAMPAFPIVVIEGLPFYMGDELSLILAMAGKTGGGSITVTSVEEFLRWSIESARPRAMPEDVPDNPLDAVDRFLSGDSPATRLLNERGKEWMADHLRRQAYRCVSHLAGTRAVETLGFDPLEGARIDQESWQVLKGIVQRVGPRWNAETLSYEAAS